MSLGKVGTADNVSDITTKPIDQKTLERHCLTLWLIGEEDHTSLMQISGERRLTRGLGDLSRLAGMASQCGSCLVWLAAMMTKADASTIPTSDDKDAERQQRLHEGCFDHAGDVDDPRCDDDHEVDTEGGATSTTDGNDDWDSDR